VSLKTKKLFKETFYVITGIVYRIGLDFVAFYMLFKNSFGKMTRFYSLTGLISQSAQSYQVEGGQDLTSFFTQNQSTFLCFCLQINNEDLS